MNAVITFPRAPLLSVRGLSVAFSTETGMHEAVRGVSFDLFGNERLAVVGESGSGKSITFRALMGLLPPQARIQGEAWLAGNAAHPRPQPLLGRSERDHDKLRGRRIGMVIQDPCQGLDPMRDIGHQLDEMLRLHAGIGRQEARERSLALLEEVGIREPARVVRQYPHQISGGMGQRVMIAMALAGEPEILIADEATSSLDFLLRDAILELLDRERQTRHMGLVLISHDLELVARHADRVLVMYAGRILETIEGYAVDEARHPYTRGLLAALPDLARAGLPLDILERDPAWRI
ncbi:MAG: ABC transporter ATP-binding protein [Zoogloeaceae bacterium]|jgi:peptide/nickel transport system ATP-binding protein|nr:ABC transporter ATP-binding protein [Zoogloeaceae bacterium]